ncbi:hypothetical protein LUZ60_000789 [Juncus effusus]|nr:hypothetical protein LUZ60_000789 [Juncus effusus]
MREITRSSKRAALLKIFLSGLKKRKISNKNMSLLERKRAIRFSADLAMAASARKGAKWSSALMADLSSRSRRKTILPLKLRNVSGRSKRILRGVTVNIPRSKVKASSIAKWMVKKRELALRRLVPGGKCMDRCTLLDETLDYVKLLKAQVDVMRLLVKTIEGNQIS